MADHFHLDRFLQAQREMYTTALAELRAGRKTSHWIWFIFPQLSGLGRSPTAQHYAIVSLEEAKAYLDHPVLGPRLHECLSALQSLGPKSAEQIFGALDATKFRSSLTLFRAADPDDAFIRAALERWFDSREDEATLKLLRHA
jgi:uncharacterized protein (DUF1810 family)